MTSRQRSYTPQDGTPRITKKDEEQIMAGNEATPFDKVLGDELDLISSQRLGDAPDMPAGATVYARARAMNLAGLAFSGGGIRSAAFNLGFIQGLANHKTLHLFDYLSTVSGGGYIGGWLSALLYRACERPLGESEVKEYQEILATPPDAKAKDGSSGFPPPEARPVRFLRRYANYLTPRLGLSGDTLALLSNMVRNVVVMQMLLVSLLVAGFSFLMLLAGLERTVPQQPPAWLAAWFASVYRVADADLGNPGRWLVAPALGLLFVALVFSLWSQTRMRGSRGHQMPNTWVFLALLATVSAGVLLALGIRIAAKMGNPMTGGNWVLLPALGYCLAWLGTLRQEPDKAGRALLGMLGGAACFALALHFSMAGLSDLLQRAPFGYAVAFAPPVAVALYSLVITVHLALSGCAVSEQQREWWARAGGQAGALGLLWTLALAFMLYVPPLIQYGAQWSVAGGGFWTVLTWLGTHLAQGKETDGESGAAWKELLARLVPWLFLGGLVGLVVWAYALAMPGVELYGDSLLDAFAVYHASLGTLNLGTIGLVAFAAGALFLLLVAFVDLNLFSAHSFYRNRLARAFLGASRDERVPNAFTGFDPDDDLNLADLAGQRPIHLVNANLNIAGGQELAWQTRRGTSFVFTPGYCGYSARTSLGEQIGGYRETREFAGGLSLAAVVAVSGAAASPNMGFHTSPAVSALLTVFNLRLARWCPNPTREQWQRGEPRFWSAGPLFSELFGESGSDSRWINLSDGGHFENLGLYELARRRAGLIVVTDVGEDGNYQFDDLAMAARKLRVDFGVHLDIQAKALDAIRTSAKDFSNCTCAIGRLIYPDCEPGTLIYVKSALTKDAPVDIRQYRDAHPTFPHESTADQWFDEDQFEAYRHLGQCIAEEICREWLGQGGDQTATQRVSQIQEKLRSAFS
jgi:hypothetical protein